MIRIEISEESATAALASLLALAAGFATGGPVTAPVEETAPEKPKAEPKKAAAKKADPLPEPVSDEAATSPTEASSAVADVDVTDAAAVKAFANKAIDVLGTGPVAETFGELGAAKFNDIAPSKYNALVTRLQDLIDLKAAA